MKIDFQGLLNVAKAAEEFPHIDMSNWVNYDVDFGTGCGTAACLVGSYCLAYEEDELYLDKDIPIYGTELPKPTHDAAIAMRFGITENEAAWLFTYNPLQAPGHSYYKLTKDPASMSKSEALARLRKFIYYKMKQSELHEAWVERHHQVECTNHVASIV